MIITISRAIIKKAFHMKRNIVVNTETGESLVSPALAEPLLIDTNPLAREIIPHSICVDVSTTPVNPGPTQYRGVYTGTREILFSEHIGYATNNIGEFLAIVDAIRWIKHSGSNIKTIYSDSTVAIGWLKRKTVNTRYFRDEVDVLIEEAVAFLNKNKQQVEIVKWPTAEWGQIYADYGEKGKYFSKFKKK